MHFLFKSKKINLNSGMSYVELIVVLAIFSVLSTVVIFNYGGFQDRVDLKNLASDIALKIVEAQRAALSGKLPPTTQPPSTWKPAYGIYINQPVDNKTFTYFVDLNADTYYTAPPSCPSGECLENISITKGSYISEVTRCTNLTCSDSNPISGALSMAFKRTSSEVTFYSNILLTGFDYVRITVTSKKGSIAYIKIYRSGRVQIN